MYRYMYMYMYRYMYMYMWCKMLHFCYLALRISRCRNSGCESTVAAGILDGASLEGREVMVGLHYSASQALLGGVKIPAVLGGSGVL